MKLDKKWLPLLLLCFITSSGFSQIDNCGNEIMVEIKLKKTRNLDRERYKKPLPLKNSNVIKDELGKVIQSLTYTDKFTFRTNNESYLKDTVILDYCGNTEQIFPVLLKSLEENYYFTLKNLEDSLEYWDIQCQDSTKLSKYELRQPYNSGGVGVSKKDTSIIEFDAVPIYYLSYIIPLEANVQSETDSSINIDKHYSFQIPRKVLRDIDRLNEYLQKKLGLKAIRKKHLVKIKYAEFY